MTDDANAPTVPEVPDPAPSATRTPDPRYTLRSRLGLGGMGEVWLAHDGRVDRDIAIKLMRAGATDPELVARFLREARVQGRLEHPSIVPVHDLAGSDAGAPFFAMKRLIGTTLADVLAGGDTAKWPRRTLLARFVDVCLAVEFAHQRGVIHRDLKPANIMLGDFGEAYVLDWGIARLTEGDAADAIRTTGLGDSSAGQTEVGAMLGTPGYMSPEQVRGQDIDERTDVFALGCILFEILAGAPASPRESPIDHTLSMTEHRPSTCAADVPPELDDATAHATAADRAVRIASARELADRVQRFLDGARDSARRRELAASHLATARACVERGDEGRVQALREASSAVALDVDNVEARALIAKLVVEPPSETPPAAAAAIDAIRGEAAAVMLRWTAIAYATFLILIPLVWLLGVAEAWPLVLIAGEVATATAVCAVAAWRKVPVGARFTLALLVLHCLLLATVAIVVGPLLLVPILVFGSATLMFMVPTVRLPKTGVVAHLLVVLVPLGLELVGVLPRTFEATSGRLVLAPWAIHMSGPALVTSVVACVALQLVGVMLVIDGRRRAQARAEHALHVQKWQLEQLVPSSGSAG